MSWLRTNDNTGEIEDEKLTFKWNCGNFLLANENLRETRSLASEVMFSKLERWHSLENQIRFGVLNWHY